ncbi:hypothetical protein C4E22_01930 [ANME-1 cluster archaeon AG-394-G06]|nr:hypothetical protein [ANME-1 cluster archaeon AG-394-G06]
MRNFYKNESSYLISQEESKKMPMVNYRRIRKGYDPKEPTTVGEQLFYILWCILCALKILGRRIL